MIVKFAVRIKKNFDKYKYKLIENVKFLIA